MSKAKLQATVDKAMGAYRRGETKSLDYVLGYSDGLKDGARRERRALKRDVDSIVGILNANPKARKTLFPLAFTQDWVRKWLAARSKPAKRKGGK